ncbi:GOLPH3/VPS74 family protein [Pseudonocardia phyllosphaerae]|uniref:GOLPH3/VPS74 family protein n=1 Tax=Pseudonocardia phyllosphaerae TaxID=3390502 RepID=UPI00397D1F62
MGSRSLLVAEDMLLIALDDDTGKLGWFDPRNLFGALLCDLIDRGAVTVDPKKKLHLADAPEHPALLALFDTMAASTKPRTIEHWLGTFPWKHSKPAALTAQQLVADGVLQEQSDRVLGLFRTTRLPEADPGPERALRDRLKLILVDGSDPGAHDALLVTFLHHNQLVKDALDGADGEQSRAGRRRAKQIAKDLKTNPVVKAQLDAAVAAAAVSIAGAAVVTASGT